MPCCPAEVLEVRSLLSAGALDLSFGVGGTGVQLVGTASAAAGEGATSMAITADGKIVVAGSATAGGTGADFALTELNANGSVNTSFGTNGHVVLDIAAGQNDHINSVAIDAFGRIVVAGTTSGPTGAPDAVVMRFNANGSVDTTFGAGGKVIFDFNGDVQHDSIANAVTVDASGKIVVAGSARIGSGGSATTDLAVARFNADGTVDSSFGASGEAIIGFAGGIASGNAVTIDASGRIVVAGSASAGSFNELAAVRLTSAGTLDASFGAGGKAVVNLGHETVATQVAIDASGRIVLGGNSTVSGSTSIVLTRLNANGSVDGSFGAGGVASASFNSGASETLQGLAIDANGNIVAAASLNTGVAGSFDVGVARFSANGTLDTTFSVDGKVRERFSDGLDAVAGVMIDANGRLVVGGSSSGD
ncbi:MAG TPA: hypothetical protein VKH44_01795, partial [Pirellulaceae bacterium]|nr:hypothetical protein [Pirellulaceae bacterium]